MNNTRPIVVVGSINIDLVVNVSRLPAPGETLLGATFQSHAGGKGANQAAAVARLGYPVFMIGRIGNDSFGQELRQELERSGVNTSSVSASEAPTGTALISVTPDGQNTIIVAPGANSLVSAEDLDANIELLRRASLVLAQLEIPMATVKRLAEICAQENIPLMLDPAPAQFLSAELLRDVGWITPNEVEAKQLLGFAGHALVQSDSRIMAESLRALGPRNVVLKLGERGAYMATWDGVHAAIPPFPVQAMDATGAGDAFNAAFAVAMARGATAVHAAHFAAAAAALSVTRCGALPSMPTQREVADFLQTHTPNHQELAN